jgi:hypothetical protein
LLTRADTLEQVLGVRIENGKIHVVGEKKRQHDVGED